MRTLTALMILPIFLFGQMQRDEETGRLFYKEVHEIPNKNKVELHDLAEEWMAKAYNNSKYVTRLNDEEKIIAKGSFSFYATLRDIPMNPDTPYEVKVDYTLDLRFKDGRFKTEFYDIDPEMSISGLMFSETSTYYMTFEEYMAFSKQYAENYDGPGKRIYRRRVENEKKMRKDYERNYDFGKQIHEAMDAYFTGLDKHLLSFIKSSSPKEEKW